MRDSNKEILHRAQKVAKRIRNRVYACLYPGCQETAICSHSQWEKGPLLSIARSSQVYAFESSMVEAWKIRMKGMRQANIIPMSISKASTFPGFCNAHDTSLFIPIETNELHPYNLHQVWCFHLRAIAHVLSRKRFSVESLDETAIRYPNESHQHAELVKNVSRLYNELEAADEKLFLPMFKEGFENTLSYCWAVIPERLPVSNVSVFCPIPHSKQQEICAKSEQACYSEVSLSIIPSGSRTDVIMVWNLEACPFMNQWIFEFMNANPKRFERFLNRMVFNHSEDWCMNPDFWETLKPSLQNRIRFAMCSTGSAEETLSTLLVIRLSEHSLAHLQRIQYFSTFSQDGL